MTNSTQRRRTGILGGSFNPVHTGHLLMAQDAVEHFHLDRVLFIPCAVPPHKSDGGLATAADRLAMLSAAVAPVAGFDVCAMEIERGGRSYSITTMQTLRRENPGDLFFFIIGDDTLADLHLWHRIEELMELCEFVTMERPGTVLAANVPLFSAALRKRLLANRRTGHGLNVSATAIRSRIAGGLPIRFLVPDAVADYIEQHGLYRSGNDAAVAP